MQYTMPTFPQSFEIGGDFHHRIPPRLVSVGNMTWGKRHNAIADPALGAIALSSGLMLLLLPALTDIRGPLSSTGADFVDVTTNRGPQYTVVFVDDFNKGTPVEFRGALLRQNIVTTPFT